MDLKKIAIIGVLGIGGVFLASKFLGSGDNSAGGGAGGGAPPGAQAPIMAGTGEPVFNISFPEPNFPSMPQIDYNYFINLSETSGSTKKSRSYIPDYTSHKSAGTGSSIGDFVAEQKQTTTKKQAQENVVDFFSYYGNKARGGK